MGNTCPGCYKKKVNNNNPKYFECMAREFLCRCSLTLFPFYSVESKLTRCFTKSYQFQLPCVLTLYPVAIRFGCFFVDFLSSKARMTHKGGENEQPPVDLTVADITAFFRDHMVSPLQTLGYFCCAVLWFPLKFLLLKAILFNNPT